MNRVQEKARYLRSNRVLDEHVKRKLELNDKVGINLNQTYTSLQIEAGGPGKLPYIQKDCRNHVDKVRRSLLVEGDAQVMHNYFMKMKADNSDFFFAMDLDDEGVNHHGQSILLGCALISHEDMESFSWLFKTWKICMWDCAPKAIITDQCMAMKNAIEDIFPNTQHQWYIWHIMKKIPEKLNGCNAYENISWCMRRAVYASLTIKQFEDAWDVFIKKYELQSNTWLEGLNLERKRWVPAYLNDVFWAGMSSTQRSENINAYFDGYVHSKTTLKQFVGQYENALGNKPAKVDDIGSEHEINEWVTYGKGEEKKRIQVAFTVNFNAETNETHCNYRLFESRGMVCKHQLFMWHQKGIERVPDKYVLRRLCKNVKMVHTKVRICYDKSSTSIEARRHDNMCNIFNEVADLVEESQEKYDMVMKRVHELKRELMEASVVCESNVVSLGDDTGTRKSSFSLGDGVIPPKQSTNTLDPEGLRRKGRPLCKRKIGAVEKAVTKKRQTSKKPLSNEKSKEVEEIAVSHHIGTQESIVNVNPPKLHGTLIVAKHDTPSHATKYGTMRKHFPIFPNFVPHRNKFEPIYAFFSKFTKLIKWSSLDGSINYCG
ncbi:protein FAR-RED IMPAIRED RESPONSE 1-like [Rhododendron vialii]|uniref:protein FAR-RED IMPAIRED RESPONSE 1-like n=1 Tax=Rhododendron vialii TaxID=182163 RepID=UPI002660415F|nr:protein FAR-RED IMPAIRED RESPONSE 1-like [Rhododendron vialii]